MPSVLTHFALLDKVTDLSSHVAQEIIRNNQTAAYWGSVGPDYLFFAPSDWSSSQVFFKFIYDTQNHIKEIADLFVKIESITEDAADFVTGGLHSEIKRTVDYLHATTLTHLAAAMSDTVDLFDFVISPQQKYQELRDWWWMDIAHSVRTAQFARTLWDRSADSASLRSYAYGFLTHVAGDVVVHPFVNIISGGPYRLHHRRHVLVEKVFDAYLMKKWFDQDVSSCEWHKKILFDQDVAFPSLPGDIARFMHECLHATYSDLGIASGVPNESDINLMYRNFHLMLKGATSIGWLSLPPPEFQLRDMPAEIKEVFADPPPPVPMPQIDSARSWKRFFKAIFRFVEFAYKKLVQLITVAFETIVVLGNAPFRYFLWLLQKLLYEIFLKAQLLLSLGAYLYPASVHLSYFRSISNPYINNLRDYKLPFERHRNSDQTYHLIFPGHAGARSEQPITTAFSMCGAAFADIDDVLLLDVAGSEDLFKIADYPDAASLESYLSQGQGFCSARSLAQRLFAAFETDGGKGIPNFNLDGDRGYGWPTWNYLNAKPWNFSSFKFEF